MTSSPPGSTILLSSRRARRHRGRQRETLPDWVWGAIIGGFVVLVVGSVWLGMEVAGSGGGGPCDRVLPPLGESEISEQAFRDEDAALDRVLELLNAGDKTGAEAAFYGPVHNFTHNADAPVRERNEQLAKDLCQAVLDLEDSLAFESSTVNIALDLQRVRNLLRDAAQALGYARPG